MWLAATERLNRVTVTSGGTVTVLYQTATALPSGNRRGLWCLLTLFRSNCGGGGVDANFEG